MTSLSHLLLLFLLVHTGLAQKTWQDYVLGPSSRDVLPVSILASSPAGVTNPQGLLGQGGSPARLTASSSGNATWPSGTVASAYSTHAPNSGDNGVPTTYSASNAIDGDASTFWNDNTEGVYPDVLVIVSPTLLTIPGITLISNSDGVPQDFTVETSPDNTTWTLQATIIGNTAVTQTIAFASPVSALAVRITVTLDQDTAEGEFTRIAEVQPAIEVTPYVDVDFGIVHSGHLQLNITAASDPAPQIRLAFSETQEYLGFTSDFSRSDYYEARGGTDDLVPAVGGEEWTDNSGCQFDNVICADGIRGFRYVRVFLQQTPGAENYSSPTGWVDFVGVSLAFTPYLGTPSTYTGNFLCSDDLLNRIWYSSVYSVELNTDTFLVDDVDPRGAYSPTMDGKTVLFDGAKRDRDPYAGDVSVQSLVDLVSHASGVGTVNVLLDLALHQRSDGWIPPASINNYTLQLFDYPAWWALASADYYMYTKNDTFATAVWPSLVHLFDGWYPTVTDSDGLLDKSTANGYSGYGDYAFLPRTGKITYYNANYVRALQAASVVASSLGYTNESSAWSARAEIVIAAVNSTLWDASTGAWLDSDSGASTGCHSQDATAFAVLAGIGGATRSTSSLAYINSTLNHAWGNGFVDNDCFGSGTSERVYGFISYPEVLARFVSGDDDSALEELRRTWGWMINHDPMNTTIEATGADISDYEGGFTSMAHGWAAGAAPALTNYVLGVVPTSPGFATFNVVPHPGDLTWAQGTVPTPYGPITVSWNQSSSGVVDLQVTSPPGTVGTW